MGSAALKLGDAIRVAKTVRVDHARKFATHVVPEVVRPARVIWNQAIGGVFLILALTFFGYAAGHRENPASLIGGLFLGFIMSFFSAASFLSARKIARR